MSNRAISLLSGGLDSTVATKLALREHHVVCALTFDYGQRARSREIDAARRLCNELDIEHRVVELPWLASWTKTALVDKKKALPKTSPDDLNSGALMRAKSVWVPNRNGTFVAVTAALAESLGANAIIAGFNAEEGATFSDNSAEFAKATNTALALSTLNKVRLISPTLNMTKLDIAKEFISLGLHSYSFWCCYEGGEKLCGSCESCARTIRAFKDAGGWDAIARRF